jgi:hypothetical protein
MSGNDRDGDAGGERKPFLARWSQRKIDQSKPAADTSAPLPVAAPPEVTDDKDFDPQAFELPIPDLDDIVAGFDMRPFLQKGVPESLKNAALRKLWVTDPAIAGFVSPALDYAHDYNTPGAAPGFGPLIGDHDLTSLMQNLFSREPKDKTPQTPQIIQQISQEPQAEALADTAQAPLPEAKVEIPIAPRLPVQNEQPLGSPPTGPAPKSRHGSALPE